MTYQDMIDAGIDIQCSVVFQQYDYDKDQVIDLTEDQAKGREIKYMYADTVKKQSWHAADTVIVIEVYNEKGE